jgi:acetate kinase
MPALIATSDTRAKGAIGLFNFRVARETGAMMASLGGLDGIVFTAGVGENAPEIRAVVAERLSWTGLTLDADANLAGAGCINSADSRLKAWVVPTDEEAMIAQHTLRLALGQNR